MDLQIKGKKAIMAGGSAGMGRATAERLAEAGVELVITARHGARSDWSMPPGRSQKSMM